MRRAVAVIGLVLAAAAGMVTASTANAAPAVELALPGPFHICGVCVV